MKRIPISSSTIRSAGYDADTATLELEFTSGHVYRYLDVPPRVYDELLTTDSAGRFFNFSVRDVYPCTGPAL